VTRCLSPFALALVAFAPAWAGAAEPQRVSLNVTATAYNSTLAQTDGTPHLGAWGDHLDKAVEAGVRVIAVSPDLLKKGLRRGQRVRIHGLKGEFVVLDRMPRRWSNRIDIYMHQDVRAARNWGRRRVRISWEKTGSG
jgi:3D (Asp-Asp-Asp) domain-containing protein